MGGIYRGGVQTGGTSAYSFEAPFSLSDIATAYDAQKSLLGASEPPEGSDTGNAGWNTLWSGTRSFEASDRRFSDETQSRQSYSATADKPPVVINITMAAPQITVGGGGSSEDEIARLIQKHYKEAADDLCNVLAERLADVYENMPNGGD